MAATDQITGVAGGATGAPLSGITGSLQGTANKVLKSGQNLLDKIISPQRREEIKTKITRFTTERPLLASFIFSQIALSGTPLALFLLMTITVAIFALLAGIIVGVIGILLFIVGALLVALFILLPTLVITTFFAVGLWLWIVGAYYIVKAFNEKKIPGIHVPLKEGLLEQTGLNNLPALVGTGQSPPPKQNGSTNGHTKNTQATREMPVQEQPNEKKSTSNAAAPAKQTPRPHHEEQQQAKEPREDHAKRAEHKKQTAHDIPGDTATNITSTVGGVGKQVTG